MTTDAHRPIRMGMVGGGQGAFIGAVHRLAARLDGEVELVCGAFSSDAENSAATGRSLRLDADRAYASYADMMRVEAALPEDRRMQFVAIVTPNHLHLPVALAALEAGFPVLSDKPATKDLDEALTLRDALERTRLPYALTHTYAGYPMVAEARRLVAEGAIGPVRKVIAEYVQGWLATAMEAEGAKQAAWRTDPARSGASGAFGDIGTHAHHLAEYVTGLSVSHVSADLTTFVPDRRLEDDGSALLRFEGGAKGVLTASQVCAGEENDLTLRVYGEAGGLRWSQQDPNHLWHMPLGEAPRRLSAGANAAYLGEDVQAMFRTPQGHPEGYLEAFANIYRDFARGLRGGGADVPGIAEGVRGLAFVDAALRSSANDGAWTRLRTTR